MDRGVGAAARLPGSDRKDLAIQALAGSGTVSDLAARHGVSRKFVYQQTHKAVAALDDAFSSATPDDEVLFELAVTRAWLRQVIVGLALICRSSYRGGVEFLRDLLGVPVSLESIRKCGAFTPRRREPPRFHCRWALVHFDDLRGGRMLFLLWFEHPDATQAQRRTPSPHPEDVVQGAELAGL